MLARSPFGSMTSVGMPSSAASSIRPIKRPVLPLPVMPTQTAWVVNRRASTSSGPLVAASSPGLPVLGSTLRPR